MFNPDLLNNDLDDVPLAELAQRFLDFKRFQFQETIVDLHFAYSYAFDLSLSPEGQLVAILLKDWARSCGVDIIHRFYHFLSGFYPQVQQGIVISNRFSLPARSEAKAVGIELLTREELVSIYQTNQIPLPIAENLTS